MANTTSTIAGASTLAVKEVPAGMEAEAALYEAFCEVPTLAKVTARVVGGAIGGSDGVKPDLWITAYFTQRNLPANVQRKFSLQALLPSGSTQALTSLPIEGAEQLLSSSAPDGAFQLVVKNGTEIISTVHQIWSGQRVTAELHVPKALHGAVLNGGYFAGDMAWAPDGKRVAYVAEVPVDEKTPAWGGPESIKEAAATKSWRGVATALEDWGELNTGKRAPAVFVLDIATRAVVQVSPPAQDEPMSYGQPTFARDGSGLVMVGWPHLASNFPSVGKRLGVVFCYNRLARLWWVPLSRDTSTGALSAGPATPLTRAHGSALSPVFTPDGTRLLYLCNDTAVHTGTHNATTQLNSLPWPQAAEGDVEPTVVLGVVSVPREDTQQGFPGLYASGFIDQPFLDDQTMLLTTQWRSANAIVAVDLATGTVAPLTPVLPASSAGASHVGALAALHSTSLAAVQGGRLLALRVGPFLPSQLVVADAPIGGLPAAPLTWTPVGGLGPELPVAVAEQLAQLSFEVQHVTPTVGDTSQQFESVVLAKAEREVPLPAVLAPHGGPHSAVLLGWYPMYAYLAALGYAVIMPNYRGSTGFGQAALQSLPGRVGLQDVEDCMASAHHAARAGLVDTSRVVVVGGSHGGFLTGHLLGQHPDAFRAGIMRNPVCNISLMVGLTDISDWCFVEVWGCEEGVKRCSAVPQPEDLERMFRQSPVAHVHNVKVPVTLMLGSKDRRVPPPDGQQYAAALRAAGVPVRVLVFPDDSHALDKPQTDFEQWITVAAVLKECLR